MTTLMTRPSRAIVPVPQELDEYRQGSLVPLSVAQVAAQESHAHALGLPSLVSLAEGIDDDDIAFPYEENLGELDMSLEDAALREQFVEEDEQWD